MRANLFLCTGCGKPQMRIMQVRFFYFQKLQTILHKRQDLRSRKNRKKSY